MQVVRLRLDTTARHIDVPGRKLLITAADGSEELLGYDKLVIGTGAVPVRPPIAGLGGADALRPADGVHLLHSMGDTFAVMATLEQAAPASAVIVGGGYIGLEMADALTVRGLAVTQMEQLPEVLPTVDPDLGALVHAELARHGVEVLTGTTVRAISKASPGAAGRLEVQASGPDGATVTRTADMVLVVVGVRPETTLAAEAGAALGIRGAIAVDPGMHTNLPDVFAAGDCVITHHRLLGVTYLPLGSTAHKQGRVAGEKRARRAPAVRRELGHPGGQDLRPGRHPRRGVPRRHSTHLAIWAAAAAIIILAAGACSSTTTSNSPVAAVAATSIGPGGQVPTLTGAGSTFDEPFFAVAFAKYQQQHPGVTIGYSAVGSSAGIAAISAQQVNFGAADVPMTASEQAAAKGGPITQVPVDLGGEGIAYNLSLPAGARLHLTGPVLAGIYLG